MSSVISAAATATSSMSSTISCITSTPDKNGHVPINDCRVQYNYYPSLGAAILFCIIFGFSLCLHIVQAFSWRKVSSMGSTPSRTWALTVIRGVQRFCWVMIMGVAWEMVAFILRALSTRHQTNLGLFLPSSLLVFLAPLCKFAACSLL